MDHASNMSAPAYPKRPGSPMTDQSMPSTKIPRIASSQLQINYLVRQRQETLPLVTPEERMPRVLQLIGEYDGVLQRHESMAGNLGACPLGPILLKRFERLFEGPPRVLKSHAKDPSVSWLDVVEFAQNRPEQFNLEKQRNGVRVCQFYHKQCRVEISEEDYVLIASGMPQKLIPPQPILEDEEKELGVMEILERNLAKLTQMADQISARARQLNHKLKNRRSAIISRRDAEADPRRTVLQSNDSPPSPMDLVGSSGRPMRSIETSQSPPIGFTPLNIGPPPNGRSDSEVADVLDELRAHSFASINRIPQKASANGNISRTSDENMSKFLTESERQAGMTEDTIRRKSIPPVTPLHMSRDEMLGRAATARSQRDVLNVGKSWTGSQAVNTASSGVASGSEQGSPSVAIPNTPSSLLPQIKPAQFPKDDGGPFKAEMVTRMENMARGERIIPPCDRCRRLQMDCMKNLTACQGCTKKHAKCSWKDVTADELKDTENNIPPSNPTRPPAQESENSSVEPTSREWDSTLKEKEAELTPQTDQPPGASTDTQQSKSRRDSYTQSSLAVGSISSTGKPKNTSQSSQSHPSKLDLRPPPLEQQVRDSSNGRARGSSQSQPQGQYVSPYNDPSTQNRPQSQPQFHGQSRPSQSDRRSLEMEMDVDHDESDRLQELARQVYRSASQSVRPGSR